MDLTDYKENIKSIIKTFAYINKEVGYAQGMLFILLPLYHVYKNDDEKM